jgi:2',3'-cyclic-nucleotide 2'-phosphodiesterase (5'-nucleotidase family)
VAGVSEPLEEIVLMSLVDAARRSRGIALLIAFATLIALLVPAAVQGVKPPAVEQIQILDISDWHGQIDPIQPFGFPPLGGAAALSTYFDMERALYPNTLTLTAGDDVGASPPISAFFEDVPAILAERLMGIQVGTFGNHNFDGGLDRLQDQIDLARSNKPRDVGEPFKYVSANLSNRNQNLRHVQDYALFNYRGVVVAVIGITNEEAPTLVFPGNFGTMTPTDGVAAAMAAKADAEAAGATVFIAITHKGLRGFDEFAQPFGELIDFANGVSGFDVIFGDHTDIQFAGSVNGQWVVENRSKGVSYSRTVLNVTRATGEVALGSHAFVTPTAAAVTPDPDVLAMQLPFFEALAPIFSVVIGESDVRIPRADSCGRLDGRLCESLVGDVITDAMRLTYDVDFAITNAGGIRDNLTCDSGYAAGFCPVYAPPPWVITRGEAQAVLPFGNQSVTLEVNGAELKTMLENGVSAMPGANGKFPQLSGLCFTYDITAAVGSRVVGAVHQDTDGSCDGAAVDLTAGSTYEIATNDFMVSGGDGYPNFFSRSVTRNIMVNDVSDWISANSPLSPDLQGRITCVRIFNLAGPACPVTL